MSRVLTVAAGVAALTLAGCGGDGDGDSPESAPSAGTETESVAAGTDGPTGASEAAAATVTTVKVGDSEFGQILFDGDDGAIYLFDKETSATSECYGDCAVAWPPVLTDGEPQAGAGAKANLLGTTQRNDGTTQVTYNDHPLYYYEDDPPGEVLCHDVEEFGGLWLVVDPAGNAVR